MMKELTAIIVTWSVCCKSLLYFKSELLSSISFTSIPILLGGAFGNIAKLHVVFDSHKTGSKSQRKYRILFVFRPLQPALS